MSGKMKTDEKLKNKISVLKQEIRHLELERNNLTRQRDNIELDRNRYRLFIFKKYRWWISLLEKKGTPDLAWLVKNTTRLFNSCDKFDDAWEAD